jgi:hypothetical protein
LSSKIFVFHKDFFNSVFSITSLGVDFQDETGGRLRRWSPPMRPNYKLALYLAPLALAALALAGLSFAEKFPEAQSAQQAAPPPETIAAETSKQEIVASALLRKLPQA